MALSSNSSELILEAAERLFAARGFAATTIKDIAAEAEVNSALLYYYFADKEALYQAVLERIMSAMAVQLRHGMESAHERGEALTGLVRAQARLMTERPTAPALLVREMLDSEGAHARGQLQRLMAGNFSQLCELVRAGQEKGEFRSDLAPELAAISTISQLVYFFVARPGLRLVLASADERRPFPSIEQFADHAAAFALAALQAPAAAPAR